MARTHNIGLGLIGQAFGVRLKCAYGASRGRQIERPG